MKAPHQAGAVPARRCVSIPTRWDWLHHALAAVTIAAGVVAMERGHLLGWLDAAMLRMVAAASPAPATPRVDPATPVLVLIDGESYDRDFGLRSPLDRERLREGLSEILDAGPERLIIDLQIEPTRGEAAQRPLDALLQSAAPRTRIVLPVPEARTPTLDATALEWMRKMCAAGIEFGSPELLSHFGVVVRLSADPLTLASVAHAPEHAASGSTSTRPGPICQLAAEASTLRAVADLLSERGGHAPLPTALRPSAVEQVRARQLAWRPGQMGSALAERASTTVVVGGAFDTRDSFLLIGRTEPLPGALVHAVASDPRARTAENHLGAWALDIFIGTVAGFLFQALWKIVRCGQQPCTDRIAHLYASQKPNLSRLLCAALWGVLASLPPVLLWALVLAAALGLMRCAALALESGLWLNPGPMILGMALHAQLLASKDRDHVCDHDHEHDHKIANWRDFVRKHPMAPLQVSLGAATLLYLLLSHH